MTVTVIKLGGSGLETPDRVDRLRRWLATVEPRGCLLFPGGGTAADVVRHWHADLSLSEDAAHWLAIASLGLTARLWCELLPDCQLVMSRESAEAAWESGQRVVLDPEPFLRQEEARCPDDAPPHHWDVTSDSLAAWTTLRWPAGELILAKIPPAPLGRRLTDCSRDGLVDPYFPGIAGQLPRTAWLPVDNQVPQPVPWLEFGTPMATS